MLQIKPLGDQAVQMTFGTEIQESTIHRIRQYIHHISTSQELYVTECIPSYTTLSIYYDPTRISYEQLVLRLQNILFLSQGSQQDQPQEMSTLHEIPVLYGGDYGPDLKDVAHYHRMSEDEVIHLHSSPTYLVYMLGFAPGFPYLGGMTKEIATPRLATPRAKVSAGSVGIAGEQTGIYSIDSPGGWQIIGHTPLPLYDPLQESPFLLQAGNRIRFLPINKKEYEELQAKYQGW